MTGTEQRLADALAARASAVNVNSVRPLPPTELVPEPRPGRSRQWLAPAAAAISIALVAALVTLVSRHAPGAGQEPIGSQRVTFHGQLRAVDALSATNAWAVGMFINRPGSLIMHWDGREWRRVATPADVSGVLLSIAGHSPDDLWAVGTWGRKNQHHPLPLIMHWNGKHWQRTRFAAGSRAGELYSVSALSATDAWAVGYANSGALLLHWNGRSWRQLPAPDSDSRELLESVAAITTDDAGPSARATAAGSSCTGTALGGSLSEAQARPRTAAAWWT